MVSIEWENIFPLTSQQGLASQLFDHSPIMLESGKDEKIPRIYRFEKAWLSAVGFKDLINVSWNSFQARGTAVARMVYKLKSLGKVIKAWTKENFYSIKGRKEELLEKFLILETIEEERPLETVEQVQNQSMVKELNAILSHEEIL